MADPLTAEPAATDAAPTARPETPRGGAPAARTAPRSAARTTERPAARTARTATARPEAPADGSPAAGTDASPASDPASEPAQVLASAAPASDPAQAPAADPTQGREPAEPVVALRAATARLGGRPVLRGIDLTVRRGEVVALLGANGSGKSTAVRTVIGQVPLTTGEIELFGTPRRRFRDWARVGYVPQRTTAASGVPATVREVVSAGRLAHSRLGLLRRADRAAVRRALESVRLADRARDSVNALSGGQHQRVLIARALAGDPELLIMDEPMAGVDLASQQVLAETLREQVANGVTVLLVLHELGPLEPLIDRAVVLRDGRVVHEGAPGVVPAGVPGHVGGGAAEPEPHLGHEACHPHPGYDAGPSRTGLLT